MALINCPECGHQVSDKASSCPSCGVTLNGVTAVSSAPTPQTTTANPNSVKCPRCGGTNLQAVANVTGKGASFWKLCFCGLLGLCGTGKTKTEHFWVCQNCGNKFRM